MDIYTVQIILKLWFSKKCDPTFEKKDQIGKEMLGICQLYATLFSNVGCTTETVGGEFLCESILSEI